MVRPGPALQFRLSGTVTAAWAPAARAADRQRHGPAETRAGPDCRADWPVRASLPVRWLSDVWACGLAVVGGHLAVGVEEPGYPRARILALRAPGADPVVLDVEADDQAGPLPGPGRGKVKAVGEQGLGMWLRQAGTRRGDLVGLAVAPDGMVAVAAGTEPASCLVTTAEHVAAADEGIRPRWVTWSQGTARRLVADGVRISTCWDIAAVHRLIYGGWRADPGWAWAHLRGLPLDGVPADHPDPAGPPDLFSDVGESRVTAIPQGAEPDDGGPVTPDGYLNAEWARGEWSQAPAALRAWAGLAREAAGLQRAVIERAAASAGADTAASTEASTKGTGTATAWLATAHSESTAELLCAELAADGLPVQLSAAEGLLAGIIGPRPRNEREAQATRAAREAEVLRHAPPGVTADLRSPVQVKALLLASGVDVPDTRAWRLEPFADGSPLVTALLEWRKAERVATTYGYSWLDASLGRDGRLRGGWTGSDGAAGRMTASAGLHNMPAVLRRAVIAEPGHMFVRADLGQIEPRVLAAVSGDRALAHATRDDDMYLPVAKELGVDRPTAKVAMIAAMYGQTTGHGGEAARRMRKAYPVAMGYLDDGDRSARNGNDLRTYGGRLVKMSRGGSPARVAGRGRYGRNALVQGAAAELFKMWAVTVRARGTALGAGIVLCLHDELLVHVPEANAGQAVGLVRDCLAETARRWAPRGGVRFVADISVVRSWADAKG